MLKLNKSITNIQHIIITISFYIISFLLFSAVYPQVRQLHFIFEGKSIVWSMLGIYGITLFFSMMPEKNIVNTALSCIAPYGLLCAAYVSALSPIGFAVNLAVVPAYAVAWHILNPILPENISELIHHFFEPLDRCVVFAFLQLAVNIPIAIFIMLIR